MNETNLQSVAEPKGSKLTQQLGLVNWTCPIVDPVVP